MKLTDIKVENVSIETIKDVLFSSKRSVYDKADCLIIFGCHLKKLLDERLEEAINILRKKNIDKILVTGGVGVNGQFNESEYMVDYLVNAGIELDNIIVENNSKTTEENIIYSIEILKNMGLLENKSFVLLSNQAHLRRIGMEFKKRLKSVMHTVYYEFPDNSIISYDNLLLDDEIKVLGQNEVKKIINFINEGILDDEEII